MNLVILAAGRGVRLGVESQDLPKSLVLIDQTPYLALEFQGFSKFPIERKILVGGFGIEHLRTFLQKHKHSDVHLLNNTQFHKGNLYSIMTARESINNSFFVFNADHYYSPLNYQKIFSAHGSEHITVFCDRDRNLTDDDMKVFSDGLLFQKMHKQLTDYQWGYVGVTYVPKSCQARYWDACLTTSRQLGDSANVEAVMNQLAEQGEPIPIIDISGSWWTEIDTPEDLEKTRKTICRQCRE